LVPSAEISPSSSLFQPPPPHPTTVT
jgi:hypothetical protein